MDCFGSDIFHIVETVISVSVKELTVANDGDTCEHSLFKRIIGGGGRVKHTARKGSGNLPPRVKALHETHKIKVAAYCTKQVGEHWQRAIEEEVEKTHLKPVKKLGPDLLAVRPSFR